MSKIKGYDTKTIIGIFILIIIVHALTLMKKIPTVSFNIAPKDESRIKLKILNKVSKSKQIVQTNKSKEKIEVKKAYLGEKLSTFARQTVAKNVGTFKNASKGKRNAQSTKDQAQKKIKKKVDFKDLALTGFTPKSERVEKKSQLNKARKGIKRGVSRKVGLSQNNDFIKDVTLGDFTRLNTQEFEFYGFYHRIRQKLEQFWGRNIQEQAQKIAKSGRTIASDTNHITALEIELNQNGEIVNVKIKGKSGVKELDTTAVRTFNDAGPFPNPPKKMLKNNRVKINWSFVVAT